jgi:MraZ protein
MGFFGSDVLHIDDRGRIKLPAEVKRLVDEEYGPKFFVTSKDGKRAELYPLREWKVVEAKLGNLPSMHPARRKFMDWTNYYGQMTDMDSQGRLTLPPVLRQDAGLEDEVVLLGSREYLEVANRERFKAALEPLTAAELSELGI